MKGNKIFNISPLGFGLMRLPKVDGNPAEIDYTASAELVDYAMAHGVNYYDMAYTYGGSETFAGRVLSKYPRESYHLATKCPPWMVKNPADFERIFDEQRTRTQTDYFDFYLMHNFAQEMNRADGNEAYFANFEKIGFYDMLQKKKAEGKIRHFGFSFHGTIDLLHKLVDKYDFDFAQIQLNYVDWTATDAKTQYEILTKRGIPIIVMEPLRGGALANLGEESAQMLKSVRPNDSLASWGLRYAASFSNVATTLSGMNSMDQLVDNIKTMENFEPVTAHETALLYETATVYSRSGAVACTGCGYCLPCPHSVNIPRIFSIYNHARLVGYRIPFDNGYATLAESERAVHCTGCGICVEKCPQHLAVYEHMREIDEFARAAD